MEVGASIEKRSDHVYAVQPRGHVQRALCIANPAAFVGVTATIEDGT